MVHFTTERIVEGEIHLHWNIIMNDFDIDITIDCIESFDAFQSKNVNRVSEIRCVFFFLNIIVPEIS